LRFLTIFVALSQATPADFETTNTESTMLTVENVPSPRWMADTSEGAILGARAPDPESCQKATKVFFCLCMSKRLPRVEVVLGGERV
jgi:hypothetical protein